MENSINSMSKPFSTCDGSAQSAEESGWTMYFEDFFANNINSVVDEDDRHGEFSSEDINCASSIVSDAASSVAAGKFASIVGNALLGKKCKRLTVKKRETKGAFVDDDLEDTASSPANSAKVFDLLNNFNEDAKQNNAINISQDKANSSGHMEKRNGRDTDDNALKKKGLCLVPLSMVVNYLG